MKQDSDYFTALMLFGVWLFMAIIFSLDIWGII